MKYNIISTGSKGNAVVLEDKILIDCGVSFKALRNVYKDIQLVLLTHEHTDHIKLSTLKRLIQERPTLRVGCCEWMIEKALRCGIGTSRLDVYEIGRIYHYKTFKISPVKLYHNVPNCGYRLFFNNKKVLYATDTNSLNGISAKHYDLYMVECNYEDAEIQHRILEKQSKGDFAYEVNVINNHLSKQKCDDFIVENAGPNSEFVYLHQHEERKQNII